MISSNLGSGYALVPVTYPDDNPDHGGGPIRKVGDNGVYAHAGNTVYRTPHLVVREAEAGARWPLDLTQQMFLPDGRIVPATEMAFDMLHGAEPVVVQMPGRAVSVLRTLVPAVAMFAGASVGYKAASRHQVWGAIGGAVVGGILGSIFR